MEPLDFINQLRKSDEYIEDIFTMGSCYQFHLLLKFIFPNAIPYINKKEDHIITEINHTFYDIKGVVGNVDSFVPLDKDRLKKVEGWSFRKNNLLRLNYCPSCDEDLCYYPKEDRLEYLEEE